MLGHGRFAIVTQELPKTSISIVLTLSLHVVSAECWFSSLLILGREEHMWFAFS